MECVSVFVCSVNILIFSEGLEISTSYKGFVFVFLQKTTKISLVRELHHDMIFFVS